MHLLLDTSVLLLITIATSFFFNFQAPLSSNCTITSSDTDNVEKLLEELNKVCHCIMLFMNSCLVVGVVVRMMVLVLMMTLVKTLMILLMR